MNPRSDIAPVPGHEQPGAKQAGLVPPDTLNKWRRTMTAWARTYKIKDLLVDEDDAEAIIFAADGIVSRLPGDAPTSRLTKAASMAETDPETALLIFNDGLNRVYDWADANRIWLA